MIMNLLKGKVKLVITYWVFGVAPGVMYRILDEIITIYYLKILMFPMGSMLMYLFIIFPFIYFPFIYIAIWNSANNYTKSKGWASLAKIAVSIGAFFLVANAIQISDQLFNKKAPVNNIAQEIYTLNRNLPTKIDAETELNKIYYKKNTLFYSYRLINLETSKIDIEGFTKSMRESLLTSSCNSKDLKSFISNGISISFNYEDKSGNKIQNIVIKPTDCK